MTHSIDWLKAALKNAINMEDREEVKQLREAIKEAQHNLKQKKGKVSW